MRYSPDGRSAVQFRAGHNMRVVEMPSGFLIRDISGHTGVVHDVDFSADGRTLASASDDGTFACGTSRPDKKSVACSTLPTSSSTAGFRAMVARSFVGASNYRRGM